MNRLTRMPRPTPRTPVLRPTHTPSRLVRMRTTTPSLSTMTLTTTRRKCSSVPPSMTRTLVPRLMRTTRTPALQPIRMPSRCATTFRLSPRSSRATSRALSSSRLNTAPASPSTSASWHRRFPSRTTTSTRPRPRPTERRQVQVV